MKKLAIVCSLMLAILVACGKADHHGHTENDHEGAHDKDYFRIDIAELTPSDFGDAQDFESMNGNWISRCSNSEDGTASYQSVEEFSLKNGGTGTLKTTSRTYTGKDCQTLKGENVYEQSMKHLSGLKDIKIYRDFKVDPSVGGVFKSYVGSDLLKTVDTFKFETTYTVVAGKPTTTGRQGYSLVRVLRMGNHTDALIHSGKTVHANNGGDEEWAGRDVIEEDSSTNASFDSFNQTKFEHLYFRNN